jgi:hypothetical protein
MEVLMKSSTEPQIVLCIPGNWLDRDELARQIPKYGGAYLLNGTLLTHTQTNISFELQVEPPDPRMLQAFGAIGSHWADTDAMRKIDEHALVTYLIGQGGSRSRAETLMHAAAILIKAGGLGVKIDSSGIAHDPDAWLTLTRERHLCSAHAAFVAYIADKEIYTCGMHSFGLRDAVIAEDQTEDSIALLRVFTWYLFAEAPTVRSGQTFSIEEGAPTYRVTAEDCRHYEPLELFNNPYGMWRLSRIVS